MFYRVTGDGPPVVFIHGAGGSGRQFGNQFQAFRDHARCYFLDLPGHGASPIVNELRIAVYARHVVAFLAELGRSATLVGHSMGGAIALEAAGSSDLVKNLVLVSTGCRLPVSSKILSGLETDYNAAVDSILKYCFSKTVDPELFSKARAEMAATGAPVVKADFHACNSFDHCSQLRDVRIPTLIICGDRDVMTPVAYSQQLAEEIPESRLEIVPQGSHMVMLEFPGPFNDILGSALADIV